MAISNRAIYSASEFMKLAGLTLATFRNARRQGLPVLSHGKARFIRGADWEAFLLARNQINGEPNATNHNRLNGTTDRRHDQASVRGG